jgi:hypothetical protein
MVKNAPFRCIREARTSGCRFIEVGDGARRSRPPPLPIRTASFQHRLRTAWLVFHSKSGSIGAIRRRDWPRPNLSGFTLRQGSRSRATSCLSGRRRTLDVIFSVWPALTRLNGVDPQQAARRSSVQWRLDLHAQSRACGAIPDGHPHRPCCKTSMNRWEGQGFGWGPMSPSI